MLTSWGIQTGLSSSTPAPGQDAASAESLESLPTLLPGLPWLLIPTDGPALLQAPQTPLGGSPPPRSGQQVVREVPGPSRGSPTRGLLGRSAAT